MVIRRLRAFVFGALSSGALFSAVLWGVTRTRPDFLIGWTVAFAVCYLWSLSIPTPKPTGKE